jgi:hypothetical protein
MSIRTLPTALRGYRGGSGFGVAVILGDPTATLPLPPR